MCMLSITDILRKRPLREETQKEIEFNEKRGNLKPPTLRTWIMVALRL